jgi:hypothetical protein
MNFFKFSDKSDAFDFTPDHFELNLGELSHEFMASRDEVHHFFGRFPKEEINSMLEEAGIWRALYQRGHRETSLEISILSNLDNRIYIKNRKGEILIHMRLKMDDFDFKKIGENLRMVYIDWLLTQNIRFKNKAKKSLFVGQEYPGLNIFKEVSSFIMILSEKLGAHGIFNVPEYFHDAVLFKNQFNFLDPMKEGKFRAIINSFKRKNLRNLSAAIHNNLVVKSSTGEPYVWLHGEMFSSKNEMINNRLFDDDYKTIVEKYSNEKYSILESP